MSGIAGIAEKGKKELVRKALTKIAYRGGAGRVIQTHDCSTLGQVWPKAHSSCTIDIDRHGVVLDGEVYNWTDLAVGATCPVDALESAYHSKGPEFVAQIDGPFALAIARPDGVFLARSLLGQPPLYYGRRKEAICFASEVKALLGWAEEIAEFPVGHYYEPAQGFVRWRKLETREPKDLPAEEIAAQLRQRLVMSVRKRIGDGNIGSWLSGGLDSATMTALGSRQVRRLHTFAVGLEGAPDLECARTVAEFLGTRHHEKICAPAEILAVLPWVIYHLESFDALLIRSSITNFLVGKLAAERVPAVFSGEGGDELFAGYNYLKDLETEELPDELVDITKRLHNTALQRVDRCSSSHGLVAKTGFLDRDVLDFALRIPPEMKIVKDERQVEKWILRRALEGLLPDDILCRPKVKFWEGAGVGNLLAAHAEEVVSDSEFAAGRKLPNGSELNTKEELFYYRIFKEHFGEELDPTVVGRTKGAPVAK
ncbi:MAG: asparagine synthase [Armatimonadetes bacterium]|nr:asparagine synthase [Armatimonadota bacterium]NIM24092.1 asparagine synthase [Armatimonadota bacterium]NIM67946.1 asparagine synthase [Armatimonadota bacterium]NIM76468.1 asparagine synthase [Armatimonadota bacterium]NIN06176.1 asparagine synthase [Armatimonadota bacterium]